MKLSTLDSSIIWLCSLLVALAVVASCSLLGRSPKDHSTAWGPVAHTETNPSTRSRAGRDSTVNNISFTATDMGAAGSLTMLALGGWGLASRHRRREIAALNTVVDCLDDCEHCKAAVKRRRVRYLNVRAVQRLHPGDPVKLAQAKQCL